MIFRCYMCRFPEMFVVEAVEGEAKVVSHPVHIVPKIHLPKIPIIPIIFITPIVPIISILIPYCTY